MPFSNLQAGSPFPAEEDRAVTSHSSGQEKRKDLLSRWRRRLWRLGITIRRPNTIYAIKTGIGCGLMGVFAFDHRTRPIFIEYSGNWAMLSYMYEDDPHSMNSPTADTSFQGCGCNHDWSNPVQRLLSDRWHDPRCKRGDSGLVLALRASSLAVQ